MIVRFWGVRGSIPVTDPAMSFYGGNTSCVEVCGADGRTLILDAGTGIRALGSRMAMRSGELSTDILLTHFHWDHLQGLPFFAPFHSPATRLRIHAPPQGGVGLDELLGRCLTPIFFPADIGGFEADVRFHAVEHSAWTIGDMEIRAARASHAGYTVGYRISAPGASLAYLPDNELGLANGGEGHCGTEEIRRLVSGADLLIHDAMYTSAEYATRSGWGHSTFLQAIRLAEEADVRALCFFHHSPDRTDDELTTLLQQHREELAEQDSPLVLIAAREGEELQLGRTEGVNDARVPSRLAEINE